MAFNTEPGLINIGDIPNLQEQISDIQTLNQGLATDLLTKGAYVPLDYRQHKANIFVRGYIIRPNGGSDAAYSLDGITWELVSTDYGYRDGITVGKEKIFFPGANILSYSEDGVIWNTSVLSYSFFNMIYENNTYILCPTPGNPFFYSNDGLTWTASYPPISKQWHKIAYGNGVFVSIPWASGDTKVLYSTDNGVTWLMAEVPIGPDAQSSSYKLWARTIAYGNDKFVMTDIAGYVYYSYDGINWNRNTSVPYIQANSGLAYGAGKFVAIDESGWDRYYYSSDGITWTFAEFSPNISYPGMIGGYLSFANDKFFIASGNSLWYSYDGIIWSLKTLPFSRSWGQTAYFNFQKTKTIAEILGVS